MSQSTKDVASLASGIGIDSIQCLVSPDASIFNSDFEATVWLREHLPVFLEAIEVVRLLEPVLERISQPGERWPALAARSVIRKHRQAYIQYRLEILGKNAHERMSACSPDLVGAFGGAEIDFMTPEEREERHQLMLELPSFAEERLAAIDRIRQRVSERRRGKAIALVAEALSSSIAEVPA